MAERKQSVLEPAGELQGEVRSSPCGTEQDTVMLPRLAWVSPQPGGVVNVVGNQGAIITRHKNVPHNPHWSRSPPSAQHKEFLF